MAKLTTGMEWEFQSESWKMWGRISSRLASKFPKNGTAHVFITRAAKENMKSIWNYFERPILESRGVKIIEHIVP